MWREKTIYNQSKRKKSNWEKSRQMRVQILALKEI